jgi:predicted nucleic acid-binding Zn ribbon protein
MEDEVPHCTICKEDIKEDDSMMRTKCKHVFHYECLKKWKRSSNEMSHSCPVCREAISKRKRKRDREAVHIVLTIFI